MSDRSRRLSGWLGRSFLVVGSLTVLFAAFQLWGTGIAESRAQDRLVDQLSVQLQQGPLPTAPPVTEIPATAVSTTVDPEPAPTGYRRPAGLAPQLSPDELPAVGNALGVLRIPTIGVEKVLVEGVGRDELRNGPGHYPDTALPGQIGNAAIAGHRTTYGAPFGDIDLLEPGDIIEVSTVQGTFNYEVVPQAGPAGVDVGHIIIEPTDTWVVEDYGDNRLTLTACHPKFSARQRIAVQATLVVPPVTDGEPSAVLAEPEVAAPAPAAAPVEEIQRGEPQLADGGSGLAESLGWNWQEAPSLALWGFLTLTVAGIAKVATRRFRRRWVYLGSTPAISMTLWFAFTHLDKMLPAF